MPRVPSGLPAEVNPWSFMARAGVGGRRHAVDRVDQPPFASVSPFNVFTIFYASNTRYCVSNWGAGLWGGGLADIGRSSTARIERAATWDWPTV